MELGVTKLTVFVFDEKTEDGDPIFLSQKAMQSEKLEIPYFTGEIGTTDLQYAADFSIDKYLPDYIEKRKKWAYRWFKGHLETVTINVSLQSNEN